MRGYAYEGEKIGQGRENAKTYLENHPELMEELDRKVRAHYNLSGADGEGEKENADRKMGESRMKKKQAAQKKAGQDSDLALKGGKAE